MKRNVFLTFLLLVCAGISLHAQGFEVKGKVTSAEDGTALPGVSVVVQGTTIGAVTDFNGEYSINVPQGSESLMFSFIGMLTQVVSIDGRTTIDVVLESSSTELDEVVVTALGIKREKREVTYQTQKVADDEITTVTPTRAASALAGKVAGLQINVQSNGVNPSTQILLRGMRSISSSNQALIVIDGSIASTGAFDDLNPNDIENISVLKGATAAALYGSDAGNGALIVTTKAGRAGQKFTVGVIASYTAEQVAYMPDFQTEYGTGWEGAYDPVENTNWGPRFDGTLRQIGPTFPSDYPLETQMVPYAPVANNLLDFFETGDSWNNTVYMTGSKDNSSFYASFGDQRTDGIVPDDRYRRNTVRVNAKKKIGKVTLSTTNSLMNDYSNVVGSTIGDQDRPLYWFILNTSANIPLSTYSDWDNPLSYGYADNYYNAYYQNPYWAVGTNRNIDESTRISSNLSLDWEIADWLTATVRGSMNTTYGSGKNWRAEQTYNEDLQPSHARVASFVTDNSYSHRTYNVDALLNGEKEITEKVKVRGILGYNLNAWTYTSLSVRADNLSIPGFYDISNGTGTPTTTKDDAQTRDIGVFGDLTVGYDEFLFLNVTGRKDWTSTLAQGNNSYFYPSVGLSFIFTDAIAALKDNSILTYGKLTASNATVYNGFSAYAINERFVQSTGFPFNNVNGFVLSGTTVDANIKQEKIQTTELGLDLSFLNGKVWFNTAFYKTATSDLITNVTPSSASAATSFLTNIGKLAGTGLELTLGGKVLEVGGFSWDLSFNYAWSETIVEEITEGTDEITLGTWGGEYGVYAIEGMPFPAIKAVDYKRTSEGQLIVDPVTGHPETEEDLAYLGRVMPPHIFGAMSNMKFKGFTVSATLDYRTGHVYYEQGSDAMEFTGRSIASVSANRQDFVIPNSVVETSPGVYEENTSIVAQDGRQGYWTNVYNDVKSNYVKDASAIKVRELAVKYELPSRLLGDMPVSKVSVGFIARNPFTWLPEENRFSDPEFSNTYSNNNLIGVGGYLQSPPVKSFGFTVNVEF